MGVSSLNQSSPASAHVVEIERVKQEATKNWSTGAKVALVAVTSLAVLAAGYYAWQYLGNASLFPDSPLSLPGVGAVEENLFSSDATSQCQLTPNLTDIFVETVSSKSVVSFNPLNISMNGTDAVASLNISSIVPSDEVSFPFFKTVTNVQDPLSFVDNNIIVETFNPVNLPYVGRVLDLGQVSSPLLSDVPSESIVNEVYNQTGPYAFSALPLLSGLGIVHKGTNEVVDLKIPLTDGKVLLRETEKALNVLSDAALSSLNTALNAKDPVLSATKTVLSTAKTVAAYTIDTAFNAIDTVFSAIDSDWSLDPDWIQSIDWSATEIALSPTDIEWTPLGSLWSTTKNVASYVFLVGDWFAKEGTLRLGCAVATIIYARSNPTHWLNSGTKFPF